MHIPVSTRLCASAPVPPPRPARSQRCQVASPDAVPRHKLRYIDTDTERGVKRCYSVEDGYSGFKRIAPPKRIQLSRICMPPCSPILFLLPPTLLRLHPPHLLVLPHSLPPPQLLMVLRSGVRRPSDGRYSLGQWGQGEREGAIEGEGGRGREGATEEGGKGREMTGQDKTRLGLGEEEV